MSLQSFPCRPSPRSLPDSGAESDASTLSRPPFAPEDITDAQLPEEENPYHPLYGEFAFDFLAPLPEIPSFLTKKNKRNKIDIYLTHSN